MAVSYGQKKEHIWMQVYKQDIAPTTVISQFSLEAIFKSHFKRLYSYAFTIVKDETIAEEMVQNVFLKMFERKEETEIKSSQTAYLYKAVYHESLNYLRHVKVKEAYNKYAGSIGEADLSSASGKVQLSELEHQLQIALNELPEQCRTIFQLSRFEELRYRQIADRLGISVKTVENQIGKALKILRVKLADYLPYLLFLITNQ